MSNNNSTDFTNVEALLKQLLESQERIEAKVDAITRHLNIDTVDSLRSSANSDEMFYGIQPERSIPHFRQRQEHPIDISSSAYLDTEEDQEDSTSEEAVAAIIQDLDMEFQKAFANGKVKSFTWDDMKRLAVFFYKKQHTVRKVPRKFKNDVDRIERTIKMIAFEVLREVFARDRSLVSAPPKLLSKSVETMALDLEQKASDSLPLAACEKNWAAKEIIIKCWPLVAKEYKKEIGVTAPTTTVTSAPYHSFRLESNTLSDLSHTSSSPPGGFPSSTSLPTEEQSEHEDDGDDSTEFERYLAQRRRDRESKSKDPSKRRRV